MKENIILGITQGIFEWIPISSEGVLALLSQYLIDDLHAIDVALFLHLGTIFAIFIYFFDDWKRVVTLKDKELLRFLVIATSASIPVAFILYNLILDMALGSFLLFLTGFGLLFTAYFHKKKKKIKVKKDTLALIAGIMQGFALIPGLSRSASTIFGVSLGEKDPKKILKLSYMISAPLILAGSFYLYIKDPVIITDSWPALLISFVVGVFTLKIIFSLSQKVNFFKFALFFSFLCFAGGVLSFFI
ncbi:MAG: undecaprenyl-diphosphate phosphatase [Patescibacteria group bacterium]